MSRLGDFGGPIEQTDEVDTFGYFGAEIRVNPEFTDAELVDFLEVAKDVDEKDPSSMMFVKNFMRTCIHPEDFDEFWTLAKKNRQTLEDRIGTIYRIIAAIAGRPTQRSTDSSRGPQSTGQSSMDDSSSRVLERLDGRPDLQLIVLQAQEQRAS